MVRTRGARLTGQSTLLPACSTPSDWWARPAMKSWPCSATRRRRATVSTTSRSGPLPLARRWSTGSIAGRTGGSSTCCSAATVASGRFSDNGFAKVVTTDPTDEALPLRYFGVLVTRFLPRIRSLRGSCLVVRQPGRRSIHDKSGRSEAGASKAQVTREDPRNQGGEKCLLREAHCNEEKRRC